MGHVTTASPVEVDPGVEEDLTPDEITLTDTPWVTVVWNEGRPICSAI